MTGRVGIVLLLVGLSAARPARAQEQPAVFVHGFAASGSDWAATADRLRQTVAIAPHLPSLSWRQAYEQQAADLHATLGGLPGSTVALAHSNGGVVARQWSRHRPLSGIVTIGTPHRGVPLVAAFHRWLNFNDETPVLLNRVLSAFSITTDVTWVWTLVEEAISWTSDFSIWAVFDLARVIGIETGIPVLPQMKPYSQYLADLNSPGNLAREAADVPHRVGITSIAPSLRCRPSSISVTIESSTALRWLRTTPLGLPVVPEVYISVQGSDRATSCCGSPLLPAARKSS
jgi:pimeloyl-ACP methyl ester carboxylesterase